MIQDNPTELRRNDFHRGSFFMKLLIIINSLDQISQQLATQTTDASTATSVAVDASALAIAAADTAWTAAPTDTPPNHCSDGSF
jgi:urease accessory protein UreF